MSACYFIIDRKDDQNQFDTYAVNATSRKARCALREVYATADAATAAFVALPKRMQAIHVVRAVQTNAAQQNGAMPRGLAETFSSLV